MLDKMDIILDKQYGLCISKEGIFYISNNNFIKIIETK